MPLIFTFYQSYIAVTGSLFLFFFKTFFAKQYSKYARIIGLCSYMLNLELVILPKTIQRRTSYCNSRVCSFRLDFVVAMLPSNLQPKASLPYGSVGYASPGKTCN